MTDQLRARIARATHAIAHDFKTDEPGDADLILIDAEQLLDTVERIVDEHITGLAGQPIEALGLDPRYYNPLAREGIRTLDQLAARTRDDLLDIRGLGATAIAHIQTALATHGLTLTNPAGTANRTAEPAAIPDFFQAGKTYIQDRPARDRKNLTIFRCEAVIAYPGQPWAGGEPGELIAFGFTPAAGGTWSLYVCASRAWAEGWTEYDESEAGA